MTRDSSLTPIQFKAYLDEIDKNSWELAFQKLDDAQIGDNLYKKLLATHGPQYDKFAEDIDRFSDMQRDSICATARHFIQDIDPINLHAIEKKYLDQFRDFCLKQHELCQSWVELPEEEQEAAVRSYIAEHANDFHAHKKKFYIQNYLCAVRILRSPLSKDTELASFHERCRLDYPELYPHPLVSEGLITAAEAGSFRRETLDQYLILWSEQEAESSIYSYFMPASGSRPRYQALMIDLFSEHRRSGTLVNLQDQTFVKNSLLLAECHRIFSSNTLEEKKKIEKFEHILKKEIQPEQRASFLTTPAFSTLRGTVISSPCLLFQAAGISSALLKKCFELVPADSHKTLLNYQSTEQQTVLHVNRSLDLDMVEWILKQIPANERLAYCSRQNSNGATLLHVFSGSLGYTKLLYDLLGKEQFLKLLEIKDVCQRTPLWYADRKEVFPFLLDKIPSEQQKEWIMQVDKEGFRFIYKDEFPDLIQMRNTLSREIWEELMLTPMENGQSPLFTYITYKATITYKELPELLSGINEQKQFQAMLVMEDGQVKDNALLYIAGKQISGPRLNFQYSNIIYLLNALKEQPRIKLLSVKKADDQNAFMTTMARTNFGSPENAEIMFNGIFSRCDSQHWHELLMIGQEPPLLAAAKAGNIDNVRLCIQGHLKHPHPPEIFKEISQYFRRVLTEIQQQPLLTTSEMVEALKEAIQKAEAGPQNILAEQESVNQATGAMQAMSWVNKVMGALVGKQAMGAPLDPSSADPGAGLESQREPSRRAI